LHTTLSSATKTVTIGHDQPFCIIGERINPTGRKAFAAQLRENDLSQVVADVEAQVAAGAHVLDVNMGVPLTDEPDLLARAIRLVQEHCDLPICIDSSIVEALEAGLDAYQGKALVNSATGEDDRMELILPLVKKYGAAVIILANDETGIPETVSQRLEITRKIAKTAMPIGADPTMVTTTIQTIREIHDEFGFNMCLGASNISFGLPNRHTLNAAFLPMANSAGLTSAIMNALSPECVTAAHASDLLMGNDPWGANWIAQFRSAAAAAATA
jgi:5-methyltetrahydrofolate--homocysteine methyltransferase